MFKFRYPIEVRESQSKLNTAFDKRAIFFFNNKNDRKGVFPSFLIIGRNKTLIITSYIYGNIRSPYFKRINDIPDGDFKQPHSSIMLNECCYLIFTYSSKDNNFFFYLNLHEKSIYLIDGKEFRSIVKSPRKIISFGTTFYKGSIDKDFFFICCKSVSKLSKPRFAIDYYKVSLDFKTSILIYSSEIYHNSEFPPHSTREINGILFGSEFNETIYLYRGLKYKKFSSLKRKILDDFYKENRHQLLNLSRENSYSTILDNSYGHDFILALKESKSYSFKLSPGFIKYFDSRKETKFKLPYSKPAHFEVGESDNIFLSCHNFFIDETGKNYFDSPAAILKISLKKGVPSIVDQFMHPTGYRYTSHQVLKTRKGEFLYTIGHPNRLFVISTSDMSLKFFIDIEEEILTYCKNIFRLISVNNFSDKSISSFCISSDSKYIVFLRGEYIFKYSISGKRTVYKENIAKMFQENTNIYDLDFNSHCFHSQVIG